MDINKQVENESCEYISINAPTSMQVQSISHEAFKVMSNQLLEYSSQIDTPILEDTFRNCTNNERNKLNGGGMKESNKAKSHDVIQSLI